MTDRTPEPQTADLVKRLRAEADTWRRPIAPDATLEREAADAIEELTAALRRLAVHDAAACEREGLAEFRELQDAHALLSKYGA